MAELSDPSTTNAIGPWMVSVELHTLPGETRPGPHTGERIVGPSEALLLEARARGLRVAVAAHDPTSYASKYDDLVDRWIRVDTSSPDHVLAAVTSLEGRVAAVTSSIDSFIGITAEVTARLGLRGPNPRSASIQRDKSAARRALAAAGIADVRWGVGDAADRDLRSPIGYPAVAKPVDGAGSWDVAIVADDSEAQALARQHLQRDYGRGVRPRRRLLFEELADGDVYSAEGIVTGGDTHVLGYSSRLMGPRPHFVELALAFAARPPEPAIPYWVETVLGALGHDWGPFHLEFALTDDGPRLIESNSRLVGAGLQHAMHRLTGTSPAALLMDSLLGVPLALPEVDGAVCELRLVADRDGVLHGVDGLDRAARAEGVYGVGLFEELGGQVSARLDTNSVRIGYVHTIGADRDQAIRSAQAGARHVRFTIAGNASGQAGPNRASSAPVAHAQ